MKKTLEKLFIILAFLLPVLLFIICVCLTITSEFFIFVLIFMIYFFTPLLFAVEGYLFFVRFLLFLEKTRWRYVYSIIISICSSAIVISYIYTYFSDDFSTKLFNYSTYPFIAVIIVMWIFEYFSRKPRKS